MKDFSNDFKSSNNKWHLLQICVIDNGGYESLMNSSDDELLIDGRDDESMLLSINN